MKKADMSMCKKRYECGNLHGFKVRCRYGPTVNGIGCLRTYGVDRLMRSPSPSDLCWVIGFTPQGSWIAPVVRAAVRTEWPLARKAAVATLGDESLAPELMERAIQQTVEYLEEISPISTEETRVILGRFYQNAVSRKRYDDRKLDYVGTATEVEVLAPSAGRLVSPIEAKADLAKILRDTSPELRSAMLMRYGVRSRWDEIAQETSKSKEAIRKSCQREMKRIRKRLGVRDRTE
jgi:DNA-directed RNA polymerase specialized sigma24 family protein